MCQKEGIIISLFLLRIIVLVFLPALLIFFKIRKFENFNNIIRIEIILLLALIVLSILSPNCIKNSSIFRLKYLNMNDDEYEISKESNDVSIVEEIESSSKYNNGTKKIYYFNNNKLPLSNKKIKCDKKNIYFKNIGNNITAVSILLSTELNTNIDPIKLFNLAYKNEIVDCNYGINTSELLDLLSYEYNVSFETITRLEAVESLNTGKIVLAEIDNNHSNSNITCEDSYIILSKINKEGNYNILNPNDREYDYICPDNTNGYGTIIKANTNEKSWNSLDIDSIVKKYIIIER